MILILGSVILIARSSLMIFFKQSNLEKTDRTNASAWKMNRKNTIQKLNKNILPRKKTRSGRPTTVILSIWTYPRCNLITTNLEWREAGSLEGIPPRNHSNAQKCYEKLGIKLPQQELRGTYSKPVWDPKSTIWQPEKSTNRTQGLELSKPQ